MLRPRVQPLVHTKCPCRRAERWHRRAVRSITASSELYGTKVYLARRRSR